jgi:hypothetical protein
MNSKNIELSFIFYFVISALSMVSCNSYEMDQEIKADLIIKAKEDVNFADVNFIVRNRNVKIWGYCPTNKSRMAIIQKLGTIHVIKNIDNQLLTRPILINQDFYLKQLADSLLAKHPESWAVITDQNVILRGNVKEKQLSKLLQAIHQQIPQRVLINQTTLN